MCHSVHVESYDDFVASILTFHHYICVLVLGYQSAWPALYPLSHLTGPTFIS